MRVLSRFLLVTLIALTSVHLFRITVERPGFSSPIETTTTIQAESPPAIQPDTVDPQRLRLIGTKLSPAPRIWLAPEIIPRRSILSSLDTWASPHQIVIRGNLAYVANSAEGILILNLQDPRRPSILSSLNTPGQALKLLVRDHYLYLADGNSGIRIVDISVPATPHEIAQLKTIGPALAVAEEEGMLYVACGKAGLQVIDIAVPTSPRSVATIPLAEPATEIAVQRHRLLVALATARFAVVDAKSRQVEYLRLASGPTTSVAWQGNRGVVGFRSTQQQIDQGAVAIFDLTAGLTPRLLTTLPLASSPSEIRISGSMMTLALGASGVTLYDISIPATPRLVATLELLGTIRSVALLADQLWLADSGGYILCTLLSEIAPVPPTTPPTLPIPGGLTAKPLRHGRHLVLPTTTGLLIYALDDLALPQPMAILEKPVGAQILEVHGHLLFVVSQRASDGDEAELAIFDFSDPAQPVFLSQLTFPMLPSAIAAGEDTLVVSAHAASTDAFAEEYLFFYDISQPSAPVLVSSRKLLPDTSTTAMAIRDRYLYVQTSDQFMIFDLNDRSALEPVGTLTLPWPLCQFRDRRGGELVLGQQVAFVSSHFSGIKIFDLATPQRPRLLGTIASDNVILDFATDNQYLYVLSGENGLLVFSLDHSSQPQFIGAIATPFTCRYVNLVQGRLWLGIRGFRHFITLPPPVELTPAKHDNHLEIVVPAESKERYSLLWLQQNSRTVVTALPWATVDLGR